MPITPPINVMIAMCRTWLLVSGPLSRATWFPFTSMLNGPNLISADFGPRHVAGHRANRQPDKQKHDQVGTSQHDYAASAASFLPFSTASSMVPTM